MTYDLDSGRTFAVRRYMPGKPQAEYYCVGGWSTDRAKVWHMTEELAGKVVRSQREAGLDCLAVEE